MVSNIGDSWTDKFPQNWPHIQPHTYIQTGASQADLNALRREVEELKKLLLAAKEFDKATGQPDCEMDKKVKLIKSIAKIVGVDLGDVFGPAKAKKKKKP